MNEILDWISKSSAYILILEGGSQNCVIGPQFSKLEKEWIPSYAGIVKTLCLYEEDEKRKIIFDYRERVETIVGEKVCLFSRPYLVAGPKMVVKADKILIIEESRFQILSDLCFDKDGHIIEENLVKEVPELQDFWTKETGFKNTNCEWRTV